MDVVPVDLVELSSTNAAVASEVRFEPLMDMPRYVVGVDAAYLDVSSAGSDADGIDGEVVVAAAVVVDTVGFELVEQVCVVGRSVVEYQPGRLAFREAPALLAAIGQLSDVPKLVVCDGQGIAHPARAGLACHVGFELGVPTIGCAKNVLVGSFAQLGEGRGSFQPLLDAGEVVGAALRTQSGVKPVFVSPGHLVDVESCVRQVLALAPRYRLPESTRAADHLVRQAAARVAMDGI